MPQGMDAIKVIDGALGLGFSLSDAIQRALGRSLTAFAGGRWSVQSVSMCLSFYQGRVYDDIREALRSELDVPREYVDRLIESQRREPLERVG